jgi:hypothetical protein
MKTAEEILYQRLVTEPDGFHDHDSYIEQMSHGYGDQIKEAMEEYKSQFHPSTESKNEDLLNALKPFESLAHAVLDNSVIPGNRTLYQFNTASITYDDLRRVLKVTSSPESLKGEREESVEFANWLAENRWIANIPDGNGDREWLRKFAYKDPERKSLKELYNEFKLSTP